MAILKWKNGLITDIFKFLKSTSFALLCFLVFALFYSPKILSAAQNNAEITSLDVIIEVKKDGSVEIRERVFFVDTYIQNEKFRRKISLKPPIVVNGGERLILEDLQVKSKNDEPLEFESHTVGDLQEITVLFNSVKNDKEFQINYRLLGAISYFVNSDGYDYILNSDLFDNLPQNISVNINLPKEIEEKDIKFSCFDIEKSTANCRSSISGYRTFFEFSNLEAGNTYTSAIRFPIGIVEIIKPQPKMTFLDSIQKHFLIFGLVTTVIVGLTFILLRVLKDKEG